MLLRRAMLNALALMVVFSIRSNEYDCFLVRLQRSQEKENENFLEDGFRSLDGWCHT